MEGKHHILVVEDDPVALTLLTGYLEKANMRVTEVMDGESMWSILGKESINLVLLDVNLPGEDGFALTRQLRAQSSVGIILITSRKEEIDRIVGLEVGADDYITKPFNSRELVLRVKNLLRRTAAVTQTKPAPSNCFHFDGWTLNMDERKLISVRGDEQRLKKGEFRLLSAFLRSPKRVLSREQLLNSVSCREWLPTNRTIDVMVSHLRPLEPDPKKPRLLITVHGVGYQFDTRVERT